MFSIITFLVNRNICPNWLIDAYQAWYLRAPNPFEGDDK